MDDDDLSTINGTCHSSVALEGWYDWRQCHRLLLIMSELACCCCWNAAILWQITLHSCSSDPAEHAVLYDIYCIQCQTEGERN